MKPLYSVLFLLAFLSSNILIGQTLTYGEVYDFEIGDVFQYKIIDPYGPNDPEGPPSFTEMLVTNKWFSSNGDTLYYEKTWKTVQTPLCATCPTNRTNGVDTLYYYNLNSIITGGPAPIWDTNNCMVNWTSYTSHYLDTSMDYSSMFCNTPSVNIKFEYADSCKLPFPYIFNNALNVFSKGLGITKVVTDFCGDGTQDTDCFTGFDLEYYKKGQTSCGTPIDLLNSVSTLDPESDLQIFPNPFKQEFTIEAGKLNITEVVIYDLLGNEILKKKAKGSSFSINLLDVESGIYVISVTQENGEQSFHRIVKR